jgi:hypothetical protein
MSFRRAHEVIALQGGHWIGGTGCPGYSFSSHGDGEILVVQGRLWLSEVSVRTMRRDHDHTSSDH